MLTAALVLINNIIVLRVLSNFRSLLLWHYYMLALAIADLMTLLPSIGTIIFHLFGKQTYDDHLVTLVGLTYIWIYSVIMLLHTAMSIDRFSSVTQPIKYRNFSMNKTALTTMKLVVFICFLFPLVLFLILRALKVFVFFYKLPTGVYFVHDINSIIAVATLPAVQSTVQVYTNLLIIKKVTELKGTNRSRVMKTIRVVILKLGLFYLCWLPYAAVLALELLHPASRPHPWAEVITVNLLLLHSAMSLVIYMATLPDFQYRKLKRKICPCLVSRSVGALTD